MSPRHARRHHRDDRHLCATCRARKAKYRYHGHVRADRTHVLCFQCFRSARERMRAQHLSQLPFEGTEPLSVSARLGISARLGVFAPSAPLNAAQILHREKMLAHLRSQQVAPSGRTGSV